MGSRSRIVCVPGKMHVNGAIITEQDKALPNGKTY